MSLLQISLGSKPQNGPTLFPKPSRRRKLTIGDAIYGRSGVRKFTAKTVPVAAIKSLLYAAVQAPGLHALDLTVAFTVIRDRQVLAELSTFVVGRPAAVRGDDLAHLRPMEPSGDTDLFHGASTLIVVLSVSGRSQDLPGAWMSVQTLLLAAGGMALGTCLIEPLIDTLDDTAWRRRLGIPDSAKAIAAIVVGTSATLPTPAVQLAPDIVGWIE